MVGQRSGAYLMFAVRVFPPAAERGGERIRKMSNLESEREIDRERGREGEELTWWSAAQP